MNLPTDIPGERWLPAYGFEGLYWVSDQGRVFSNYSEKLISLYYVKDSFGEVGSVEVSIQTGKGGHQNTHTSVGRLVLSTFVRPPTSEDFALCVDGDRTHVALSNLRWGTRTEVQVARWKTRRSGLTGEDVREILSMLAQRQREVGVRGAPPVWRPE